MRKKNFIKTNKSFYLFFVITIFFITTNSICKKSRIELIEQHNSQNDQKYLLYSNACYHHFSGKIDKSLKLFQKSFSNNFSVYIYEGFFRLLFDIGQFTKIIDLEKKVKGVFDNNLDIQLIFAKAFFGANIIDQAEKLFEKLVKKYPYNEPCTYYMTICYIKNNKIDKALQFIEKCIKNPSLRSKHFLFYFLASRIHLQSGNNQKALELIKHSLNLYPRFEKGWLFKALLEEQLGRVKNAISGYQKFLDIVGRDLIVEKQLINLLYSSGEFNQAADLLRKIKANTTEHFSDLALLEWKAGNYKEALKNINKSLQKNPQFRKSKLLKIEVLLSQNKKDEVLEFLKNWISREPQDISIIRILLLLNKNQNPISKDSILNVLENISKKIKNPTLGILSALIDLYLEKEEHKKVILTCQKLLMITNDEEIKSKILFQIGYTYFVKNEYDNAKTALKKAIKTKNPYLSAFNLLAYIEKDLVYAEKLARIAVNAQPNCYYYLDTLGFVLLKQKKINEATSNFKKALRIAKSQLDIKDENLILKEQIKEINQHLKKAELFNK
ncbi:tetratricopeptide repeat protein [Candidatus Babeliales bacterium]|nr:tetratricopeptide repeat protein [Candidatus Babeliales bacterium]